jgi:steroid 5-alpha reductase family enzyme
MTWTVLATALAAQWLAFSLIMAAAWILQQRTGNSGWVDVSWTFGLGAVAAAAAIAPLSSGSQIERQLLVSGLIAVWSLRLGLQIVQRTLSSDDDPRYRDLASQWGEAAALRMFGFLQVQALASVPLLATVLVAAHKPGGPLGISEIMAAAVLLVAIAGEGVADRQLWNFKQRSDNHGQVFQGGLWRYSRHPNYFFQWLGWLAYPLIAIDLTGGHPFGWLALAGPLTMYVLLVHGSGIPPLEAHMLRSRGDAYRSYQKSTSAFFPFPPANKNEMAREHHRSSHQGI